jgi:hypothetical protein
MYSTSNFNLIIMAVCLHYCVISFTECNGGTFQKCPFGVNTTIELKNITTSVNSGIWRSVFWLGSVPVLWDVVAMLFSSIVVLDLNGHFLDCTSIAFSEGYAVSFGNVLPNFRRNLLPSSSGSSTGTFHALLNLKIKLLSFKMSGIFSLRPRRLGVFNCPTVKTWDRPLNSSGLK